ncbi:hypothetical protein [Pseudomonas sp. KCJK9044]|uniref:hypothetical protein n=1 Tax=Pseudomonas sp. KCJK9044 TaxID=3344562 RepID=UPI003906217D
MKSKPEKSSSPVFKDFPVHYRINPKTGAEIPGRYIWTPIDESIKGFDEVLLCSPPPTELLKSPDSSWSIETMLKAVGRLIEPDSDEATAAESTPVDILSLDRVGANYYDGCTCRTSYPNNCAHFLSNAFILAGYTELLTSSLITARCPHRRPIRAQDMLKWFQAKKTGFWGSRMQRNTGWWAVYQETPGWQHVFVSDSNNWTYYGTGDFPDWPIQWNFRIS